MASPVKTPTKLVLTHDTLTPGLKAFPERLDAAVAQTMDYFAVRSESYMKQNAPWTDRTTNARNGLSATAFHDSPNAHGIVLAHGVPYGIWLEVRFDGKYAIITPSLEVMGAEVMDGLRLLFTRL